MIVKNLMNMIGNKMVDIYRNYYFGDYKTRYDFDDNPLNSPNAVSQCIEEMLKSPHPCMISRFGSTELTCVVNYGKKTHPFWFLRNIFPFWASWTVGYNMMHFSGFFPNERKYLCDFSNLILEAAKNIDLLGSWVGYEKIIDDRMTYKRCPLLYLEPYWADIPWTRYLKGKKVLVVHPFADSIKEQYAKRRILFDNIEVLPDFGEIIVIKAVQSLGGDNNGFKTWFDALHHMERIIDAIDYDVALIGCGAYGMPLASHCKMMGKKAIHLGGALQLLFGIKGNRWEEDGYGSDFNLDYTRIINNPNWIRAKKFEASINASEVEGACYW